MIRQELIKRGAGEHDSFRWRGGEVSRIEGFSDAVFAFSVTLIVISLEVPKTFDELLASLRNAGAFGICFIVLVWLWSSHYTFFRRYGLEDTPTIILNTLLLFVIVMYIYPLKFLFTLLVNQVLSVSVEDVIRADQGVPLLVVYGVGYFAVFAIFALMYYHAYRQRIQLQLDELEVFTTTQSILTYVLQAGVALISIAIAVIGGPGAITVSGFAYPVLIFIFMTAQGFIMGARRRKIEARISAAQAGGGRT